MLKLEALAPNVSAGHPCHYRKEKEHYRILKISVYFFVHRDDSIPWWHTCIIRGKKTWKGWHSSIKSQGLNLRMPHFSRPVATFQVNLCLRLQTVYSVTTTNILQRQLPIAHKGRNDRITPTMLWICVYHAAMILIDDDPTILDYKLRELRGVGFQTS